VRAHFRNASAAVIGSVSTKRWEPDHNPPPPPTLKTSAAASADLRGTSRRTRIQRVQREPPGRRHAADGCHRPTGARAGTTAAAPSGRESFERRGEARAVAATAPPPPTPRPVTVGAAAHCDLHCWLGGGAEGPSNCSPLRLATPPSPRPYARCGGWKESSGTRRGVSPLYRLCCRGSRQGECFVPLAFLLALWRGGDPHRAVVPIACVSESHSY